MGSQRFFLVRVLHHNRRNTNPFINLTPRPTQQPPDSDGLRQGAAQLGPTGLARHRLINRIDADFKKCRQIRRCDELMRVKHMKNPFRALESAQGCTYAELPTDSCQCGAYRLIRTPAELMQREKALKQLKTSREAIARPTEPPNPTFTSYLPIPMSRVSLAKDVELQSTLETILTHLSHPMQLHPKKML